MQALSDEQQIERLEKKVEDGFADSRAEFRAMRAELRAEIGALYRLMIQCFAGFGLTMILGFAGIVIAMLTQF